MVGCIGCLFVMGILEMLGVGKHAVDIMRLATYGWHGKNTPPVTLKSSPWMYAFGKIGIDAI